MDNKEYATDEDDDQTTTTTTTMTSSSSDSSSSSTTTTPTSSRTVSSGAVYHTTEMASDGAISPKDLNGKSRRKASAQNLTFTEAKNIINGTCRVEEAPFLSLTGRSKLQSVNASRSLESVLSTLSGDGQLSSVSRHRRISENFDRKRQDYNLNVSRWSSDSSRSSSQTQQESKNLQHNESGDRVDHCDTNGHKDKCTMESSVQVDFRTLDVGRSAETDKVDVTNSPIFKSVTNSASNVLRISPLQRSPLRPAVSSPVPNRSANKPDRSNFNEMLFDYLLYLIDARWNELGDDFRRLVQEKCGDGRGGSYDARKSGGRLTENELKMCKDYLGEFSNENLKKKFASMIEDFAYQFGNVEIPEIKETLPNKRLSLENIIHRSTSPVSTTPSRPFNRQISTPRVETSACKIESTSAWTERTSDLSLRGTISADSSCLSSGKKRCQKAPKVLEIVAMLESKNQHITGVCSRSNQQPLSELKSTSITGTVKQSNVNSRSSLSIKDRMNEFLAESLKLQNLDEEKAKQTANKNDQDRYCLDRYSTPESLETKEVEKCKDRPETKENADLFLLTPFSEIAKVENELEKFSCIEIDKKSTDTFTCLRADTVDANIICDAMEDDTKRETNESSFDQEFKVQECPEIVDTVKNELSTEPQIFLTIRAKGDHLINGGSNVENVQESCAIGSGDAKKKNSPIKHTCVSARVDHSRFRKSPNTVNARSMTINRSATASIRNTVTESSPSDDRRRRFATKNLNRTPVSTMTIADVRRTTSTLQNGRLCRFRSIEFNSAASPVKSSSSTSKKVALERPTIRMTKAAILRSKAIRQNYSLENSPLGNVSFTK